MSRAPRFHRDTLGISASGGLAILGNRCLGQRLAHACADDVWVIGFAGEDRTHHGRKEVERQGVIVGVKRRLIPALAEFCGTVEIGVAAVAITLVLVKPVQMVAIVQLLEITVGLHQPGALFTQWQGA